MSDCAKPRRYVVYGEAVLPKTMRGSAVALHVKRGNPKGVAKAREN